jgi:hypothetical protein
MVGDAAHHGVVGAAVGEADDAGREGEQVEQPDHRQQRQQAENIGLGLGAADRHQRHRHRHDAGCHQQHQHDATAAPRRFVGREGLGGRMAVGFGGHRKRHCPSAWGSRAGLRAPPECLNRACKRKSIRRLIDRLKAFQGLFLAFPHVGRPERPRLRPMT